MPRVATKSYSRVTTINLDNELRNNVLDFVGKDKPYKSLTEAVEAGLGMILRANGQGVKSNIVELNSSEEEFWEYENLCFEFSEPMEINVGDRFKNPNSTHKCRFGFCTAADGFEYKTVTDTVGVEWGYHVVEGIKKGVQSILEHLEVLKNRQGIR